MFLGRLHKPFLQKDRRASPVEEEEEEEEEEETKVGSVVMFASLWAHWLAGSTAGGCGGPARSRWSQKGCMRGGKGTGREIREL